MTETIKEEDVDLEFGDKSDEVKRFSAELQQLLYDRTQGAAWDIARGEGNGLESYRQLKCRYEPRTAGIKIGLLKQLICISSATKVDEVDQNARHMEDLIKRYETTCGNVLPEDIKVIVPIALCSKELREHMMELTKKDLDYKSTREEILPRVRYAPWTWTSWGPGSVWGEDYNEGYWTYEGEHDANHYAEHGLNAIAPYKGYGKGYGFKGKPQAKGNSYG